MSALQKLAQGAGVLRDDLRGLLNSDLVALRNRWCIDMSGTDEQVQRTVAANLRELIHKLEPPRVYDDPSPDAKRAQFLDVIKVCFNLKTHPGFEGEDLTGRQIWLAKEWAEDARVSKATSGRWLKKAIGQMEQEMLKPGYEPTTAALNTVDLHDLFEPIIGGSKSLDADAQGENVATDGSKKQWPRPRWIALTAVGAVVVLTGAYEIAKYELSASMPHPSVSSSANTESNTGGSPPIAVTAQLTTTFLDGDGVWVFPPTIGANPLEVIAGIASQITSSAPGLGGKLVSPGIFRITFDNTSPYAVTINSLRPAITSRTPPAAGILVTLGGQGTEILGQLGFNLDAAVPYAQEVGSDGKLTGTSFFKTQSIRLVPGEQDEIDLTAVTVQADYTFKLELGVSFDGHLGTFDFDGPNDKPFEITGKAAHYESKIENGVNPSNPAEVLYATP